MQLVYIKINLPSKIILILFKMERKHVFAHFTAMTLHYNNHECNSSLAQVLIGFWFRLTVVYDIC